MLPPPFLIDGPRDASHTLVLAHGAGAGMSSPFLERLARRLAGRGVAVVRFEFPYMRRRRLGGGRRPPDRTAVLEESWRRVAAALGGGPRLVIGGKSMGGRIASRVADELSAAGLICLGYPFHPPRRPERTRVAHLAELVSPTLIVQGTRDPFGSPEEVAGYRLSPAVRLAWIEDGDHSLVPRKRSGRTEEDNLAAAVEAVLEHLHSIAGSPPSEAEPIP